MQIKMLHDLVGPGVRLVRGKVYDLDATRATELLNSKFATPVVASHIQKREKAVRQPNETR